MDPLKRYNLFGGDYAKYSPLGDAEVAWHLRHTCEGGGAVLGLACGTARLLCRLAEAGREAAGLDLSPTMLDLARRNVEALVPEVRARITLVQGDMSAFRLGRAFGMIHIADNSFRELAAQEAMLACLRSVRAHLAPGGRFLVSERRFDPALYPDGRRTLAWSEPVANPVTGEKVRRRVEVILAPDAKSIRGEFIYEIVLPDGPVVERCPFESLVLSTSDYLALFSEAGLDAQAFAEYTERPAGGSEKMTCFVCRAPS